MRVLIVQYIILLRERYIVILRGKNFKRNYNINVRPIIMLLEYYALNVISMQ